MPVRMVRMQRARLGIQRARLAHACTPAVNIVRARATSRTVLGAAVGLTAAATFLAAQTHGEAMSEGGSTVHDDYEFGKQLGSGNFATVHKGICKRTGAEVAIKIVPKDKQTEDSIRHEAHVLKRVSLHKRIARMEALYETSECFYIVMEYVGGGEVFDHLCTHGAMSEEEASTLVSELAGAIAILHAQGMCHADIKPENLLLTKDGHVKLVDFGLSCQWALSTGARVDPNHKDGVACGSLPYWAPEVFEQGPGLPNDMWGLGVLTYMLLTAGHPFDDNGQADDATIKKHILDGAVNWAEWPAVSSRSSRHLVERCLERDPSRRLTIEQLLQHPWIRQGGEQNEPARNPREAQRRAAEAAERASDHKARTARLRAACFSLLVQDIAAERAALVAADPTVSQRATAHKAGKRALARHNSVSGAMLQSDMLMRTFRVFDAEGKGYISASDLQRVLHGLGQSGAGGEWMAGATDGDREGKRITYGSFVRLMAHSVKAAHREGECIFKRGDEVRHFYCLLNGEVEVVRPTADGKEEVLNTLRAGEYFGENALLEGARTRNVTIRCVTPCEVVKLSKADFEAGIGSQKPTEPDSAGGIFAWGRLGERVRSRHTAPPPPSGSDEELQRRKLISFIRMVCRQQRRSLNEGEAIFRAGDPSTRFYILSSGELAVRSSGGDDGAAAAASDGVSGGGNVLGTIRAGEGFGEMSLLSREPRHTKTVVCDAPKCDVVEILGDDFMRLVEKSRVVRQSFERLHSKRQAQNEQALKKNAPAAAS